MRIIRLTYLMEHDIKELLIESQEEGFFFLTKLVVEYKNGQNVFNKIGERLWEVYGEKNKLIGAAGLSQNPYSQYANFMNETVLNAYTISIKLLMNIN